MENYCSTGCRKVSADNTDTSAMCFSKYFSCKYYTKRVLISKCGLYLRISWEIFLSLRQQLPCLPEHQRKSTNKYKWHPLSMFGDIRASQNCQLKKKNENFFFVALKKLLLPLALKLQPMHPKNYILFLEAIWGPTDLSIRPFNSHRHELFFVVLHKCRSTIDLQKCVITQQHANITKNLKDIRSFEDHMVPLWWNIWIAKPRSRKKKQVTQPSFLLMICLQLFLANDFNRFFHMFVFREASNLSSPQTKTISQNLL